jgi:predicted transcriptional regulator
MVNQPPISPNQLRAARGWLGWTRGRLTLKSGISERAIARYELGRSVPHDETLSKLRSTLEEAGIRFHFTGKVGTGVSVDLVEADGA